MDQDNERLLDPDSNPDLEWWSDLSAPSDSASKAQDTATDKPEPGSDPAPTATDKAVSATTPDKAASPAPVPTPTATITTDKATAATPAPDDASQNSKSKPPQENSQLATRHSQPPKSAVIDRFEGKWAVLLVGEDEHVLNVPRTSLPKRVKAGHWLKIQQSEDDPENLISVEIDKDATDAARARIADKLAKLRSGEYLK